MGLLYCFLTVTLRANQTVTGLAMTTFGAVSYTHLDVYKRQPRTGGSSPRAAACRAWSPPPAAAHGSATWSVSYTHLIDDCDRVAKQQNGVDVLLGDVARLDGRADTAAVGDGDHVVSINPVSYTHLDVYKRQ